MRNALLTLLLFSGLVCLATVSSRPPHDEQGKVETAGSSVLTPVVASEVMRQQPKVFVPNCGQWNDEVRYQASFGAMTLFMQEGGWTITLAEQASRKKTAESTAAQMSTRSVAVRMSFESSQTETLSPQQQLQGVHHYFLGSDPKKWCRNVPLYGAVRYREVRPGVDVLARTQDEHFEYDLILKPDAELEHIAIRVEGIERMHIDDVGSLVLETELGPLCMQAPPSWEEGPLGEKVSLPVSYVLLDDMCFGFESPERREGWVMVVDPGIVWSTLIGGIGPDYAHAVALDAQGSVTIAGTTNSPLFPTSPGAYDRSFNGSRSDIDVVVSRFSSTGSSLIYSTFLGGVDAESVVGISLDSQGEAVIAGMTYSPNFPTTPGAFDTSYNGGVSRVAGDVYVARLSSSGSSLVFSTLLGGAGADDASAFAVDATGAITVVGWTGSNSFPTTVGAFDTSHNGGKWSNWDGFVSRLSPSGSQLIYSTFLGGAGEDKVNGVALDPQGVATVVGTTESPGFPTIAGAFDASYNGDGDLFVSQVSVSGSSLLYSTFLGGSKREDGGEVVLDAQGNATVAGKTISSDFPTTAGAFDTRFAGGVTLESDIVIAQLSFLSSSLTYSTYLGGEDRERVHALALDAHGSATLAGMTKSADFPTTPGAFDASYDRWGDAYVTRLSPDGSSLLYSTFLGSPGTDEAYGLALDASGTVTVVGGADSTSYPTTPGAYDRTNNGGWDATITRLDMVPLAGLALYGSSSPGCADPLAISVTSLPSLGNASFSLTCTNAPPLASGGLMMSSSGLMTPIVVLGAEIWIDPNAAFLVLGSVASDRDGNADYHLPIPSSSALRGAQLYAQFAWSGPNAPIPCPKLGLSTSNALHVTVQ